MADARFGQQALVFGGGQPDQAVQGRGRFLEHGRPGAPQEAGGPAQVAGQVAGAVAELNRVVTQQPGQLAPQAGMVERHEGTAGQHAGIAVRGFQPGGLAVDQGDIHAAALQFQRTANADHAGAKHNDWLSHRFFRSQARVKGTRWRL